MKCGTLIFALLLWTAGVSMADTIIMKNGDRLSGKIEKIEGNRLLLITPYAGKVNILTLQIATISSNREFALERLEEQDLVGKFALDKEGKQVFKPKDAPEIKIDDFKQVIAMRDSSVPKPKPIPVKTWHNIARFGLMTLENENNVVNLTAQYSFKKIWKNYILEFYGRGHYNETKNLTNDTTNVAINQGLSGVKFTTNRSVRRYYYAFEEIDFDHVNYIDWRSNTGVGIGYKFLKKDRIEWAAETGLDYIYETHLQPPKPKNKKAKVIRFDDYDSKPYARFAEILAIKLGVKTSIQHMAEFYPSLEDPNNYFFNTKIGLHTQFSKHVGWDISAEKHYESEPFNKKYNDSYVIVTNLVFSW